MQKSPEMTGTLPDVEFCKKVIDSAQSLDKLCELIGINQIALEGTEQTFTPEMLQSVIRQIQEGKMDPRMATRIAGFRDKVIALAKKEGIEFSRDKIGERVDHIISAKGEE